MRRLRRRAGGLLGGALMLLSAGCSAGSASALHVRLDAGPAVAPFDTPVHVLVSGLPPGSLLTMQARTRDAEGRRWESAARFRASPAGTLDLATAVPVSGTYRLADPGGLLWSLRPVAASNPATRFDPPRRGASIQLRVLAGGGVQATATLLRQFAVPAVRQTVRRDGLASTLFVPASVRPGAPAVVVLGGSEGGEDTRTASALALNGYPALALAYFQEPGLPQCLCAIPLEYFARALRWLRGQPVGRGRPVILYGVSRGAEAALLVASYEPRLFTAVVADSPSASVHVAFGGTGPAWTFRGKPLTTGAVIPVDRIRVPLLLGDGGQDKVWNSAASAQMIMQELGSSLHGEPYCNLYYPAAGHGYFGLPPYFPYSGYAVGKIFLGGSKPANALATEQFWAEMIKFLDDPWGS
jgi:dienelactone hydrolase